MKLKKWVEDVLSTIVMASIMFMAMVNDFNSTGFIILLIIMLVDILIITILNKYGRTFDI